LVVVVVDVYRSLPYVSRVVLHPKPCTLIYTGQGLNAIQSISYINSILLQFTCPNTLCRRHVNGTLTYLEHIQPPPNEFLDTELITTTIAA
jgi:hypothetical protein